MYSNHTMNGYRRLTINEQNQAEEAIRWLLGKHVKPERIATLSERALDRESKCIYVPLESQHLVYYRKLRYARTPFETYLTDTLPCLKVKIWLFPNRGWTGKTPSFGFHIHLEDLVAFEKENAKKLLHFNKRYAKMKLSTTKSNIQNQLTVGRRIALRA